MYKCSTVTYVPFNKCITDKKVFQWKTYDITNVRIGMTQVYLGTKENF